MENGIFGDICLYENITLENKSSCIFVIATSWLKAYFYTVRLSLIKLEDFILYIIEKTKQNLSLTRNIVFLGLLFWASLQEETLIRY